MPIYEFRCQKCKCDFEEIVRSSEEKVACPDCKSKKVSRKPSVFGFKSGSKGRSSSGSSGCSSCSSSNCSTCH